MNASEAVPSVKQCCAQVYGSAAARFLLGDSFHPGGIELTLELTGMLRLSPDSAVLDVACGKGTSALAVAERFGCRVTGIDLSAANVAEANVESAKRGLSERVTFDVADAEKLPFEPASFDAVLCECAFCTFPDKARGVAEFYRVLRSGGRLGISDLTRASGSLPELDGLLAWVACIGDAQPLERYAELLSEGGFTILGSTLRDGSLRAMVEGVHRKLLFADVMIGLEKLELPGFDVKKAKAFADAAGRAVANKQLGYALLVAEARCI